MSMGGAAAAKRVLLTETAWSWTLSGQTFRPSWSLKTTLQCRDPTLGLLPDLSGNK